MTQTDYQIPIIVPRTKMKKGSALSVNEMLVTIGRAYLASGQHEAVHRLKQLSIPRLAQEYEWSVAYLSAKGLLSTQEEIRAIQYATEYLDNPFS